MKALIELKNITKTFDDQQILKGINLNIYENVHKLLILDYLNCFNIKPSCWWSETIQPKEKNEILRTYHKQGKLNCDLNLLYKYSLVILLKEETIIAIYKDNNRLIYTIKI